MRRLWSTAFLAMVLFSAILVVIHGTLRETGEDRGPASTPRAMEAEDLVTVLSLGPDSEVEVRARASRLVGRRYGRFRLNPVKVTEMNAVAVDYRKAGVLQARITADRAVVDMARRGFEFDGKVEVEAGGMRIRCSHLSFDGGSGTISTDEVFQMVLPDGQEVLDRGLTSDVTLSALRYRKVSEAAPTAPGH